MPLRSRLTVGVAQVDCALGDIPANVERHREAIDEARGQGVELLVFPELSLTGYQVGGQLDAIGLLRDEAPLAELAGAAGSMRVVVGFVEEVHAAQFYNSSVVLHDGGVGYVHRKVNLANYGNLDEGKHFASGRYVETFAVDPAWRASVLICADAWNPALVNLAALHGTTLMICPVNSAHDAVSGEFSNPAGWDLATRFYAMIYGMPFVMANRVGLERGLRFWGGSRIVDPSGEVTAEAGREGEEVISAELDYEQVRRARLQLPTVRDSNLGLVHREIARLQTDLGVPEAIRKG